MLLANVVSEIQAALLDSGNGNIFISREKLKYRESDRYMVENIKYVLVLVYLVLRTFIHTRKNSCTVYRKPASSTPCIHLQFSTITDMQGNGIPVCSIH